MRIRQIKPSWWRDKALQMSLRADTREFYIGLWCLADDAGWLDWDPTIIGAELYAYRGVKARERVVERHAELLQELSPAEPHLLIHPCGHAQVPKMPQHQRTTGKQTFYVREKHVKCLAVSTREPPPCTDSPGKRKEERGTSNGTRKEERGSARAREVLEDTTRGPGERELAEAMLRIAS